MASPTEPTCPNPPLSTHTTPLPTHMKAQLLTSLNHPYVLTTTLPLPRLGLNPSPHDILIKVTAASYCHTDHVLATGGMSPFPPTLPHIGCHEFAGTIVSLPNPSLSPYKPGDRVGVPGRAFHPCEKCFECLSGEDPPGYSVYCPAALNNGISAPGGFREYAVVDSRQVAVIPARMSDVEASVLMCAGLTIYNALKRCVGEGREPEELEVGIIGCGGGLGHLGLQFALAMGFRRVVGVDNADGPLGLARLAVGRFRDRGKAGREDLDVYIVDTRVKEVDGVVRQLRGKGQDREEMVLDAVIILPESQQAFDYGVGLLRNHGRCVVVSFPEKGFRLASRDVVFRDITVMGSLVGSNKTLKEMLQFAADKGVKAEIKTFPLEGLNELVEEYHKAEGGKLVVDMSLSP